MADPAPVAVDAGTIAAFERDGVVMLPGHFGPAWVDRLRAAVDRTLAMPSPHGRDFNAGDGDGRFFGDMFLWRHDADFRALAFDSPAPGLAAALLCSRKLNLLYDQLFVKEPGAAMKTPWHHDQPYWPVQGTQVCSLWLALDAVTAESGAVEFIAGSHRWGKWYKPTPFRAEGGAAAFVASDDERIPDIDAARGDYRILCWDMQPGDCLVFHALTVHGAPGNASASRRRRGHAVRYTGDDATYAEWPGMFKFPYSPGLAPGAPLDCDLYPRVWPRPQG